MPRHLNVVPLSNPPDDRNELHDAVEDYLAEARRLRPKTQDWYARYLGKFTDWLDGEGIDVWARLDPKALRRWAASLYDLTDRRTGQPLRPKTLHSRVLVVRTFLRWAGHMDLCDDGLWSKLRLPRLDKHIIATLNPDQIGRLVEAIRREEAVKWLLRRNMAIFLTLLGTGIRVSECGDLRLSDVHLHAQVQQDGQSYLTIRSGKGGKGREVPLPAQAEIAVRRYLIFRPKGVQDDHLFLSRYHDPMNKDSIRQWLDRVVAVAGRGYFEGVRVSPHTLRHTFAVTYLTMQNGDIFRLKELMGHESISTTQVYLRDFNQRTARLDAPNVLDRMLGGTRRI